MSKNIEIRKRISILEQNFKKSGNTLGKEAGLGNSTIDNWTDKHLDVSNIHVSKFLTFYRISETWWQTGEGEIFDTSDRKQSQKMDVYKKIIEGDTEYLLIPRDHVNHMWAELERKNKLIDVYQDQIGDFIKMLAKFSSDFKEVKHGR